MLDFNPRRQILELDGALVSFSGFSRHYIWPESLAQQLRAYRAGKPLAQELEALLINREFLIPPQQNEEIFSLTQTRPAGWTNSARGAEILERQTGKMAVLDALSFDDIERLPKGGAFLYAGTPSFYAAFTCSSDGKIPCARCLTLRYLAGQAANPMLYRALKQGARVAFTEPPFDAPLGVCRGITVFGQSDEHIEEVLPLPDCLACLAASRVGSLAPGVFSPIRNLIRSGTSHGARLPQMLWLAGEETVGSGGAYDEDPDRGQIRARNEALERYAAHFAPSGSTADGIVFQSPKGPKLFSRKQALLTEPGSLSTGLACRDRLVDAIADGLAEVCERDALARFWLALDRGQARTHELSQQKVAVSGHTLQLTLYQLDSYHLPTVFCLGQTIDGRVVTGSACAPRKKAVLKASAECLQNAAYFIARLNDADPYTFKDPPETFEHHIGLYWIRRYPFPDLSPFSVKAANPIPLPAPVYHCDLTPPDLALTNVHAVRVQVPGLIHLPMRHIDWPEILRDHPQLVPPKHPHPFA